MTPAQHAAAAEQILASLETEQNLSGQKVTWQLMRAQVHATLALRQPPGGRQPSSGYDGDFGPDPSYGPGPGESDPDLLPTEVSPDLVHPDDYLQR